MGSRDVTGLELHRSERIAPSARSGQIVRSGPNALKGRAILIDKLWTHRAPARLCICPASPVIGETICEGGHSRCHFASWKITPSVKREPEWTVLTPCRVFTR
jgi:hypothetical protein